LISVDQDEKKIVIYASKPNQQYNILRLTKIEKCLGLKTPQNRGN
jgi:hypothetical protein